MSNHRGVGMSAIVMPPASNMSSIWMGLTLSGDPASMTCPLQHTGTHQAMLRDAACASTGRDAG